MQGGGTGSCRIHRASSAAAGLRADVLLVFRKSCSSCQHTFHTAVMPAAVVVPLVRRPAPAPDVAMVPRPHLHHGVVMPVEWIYPL